MSIDKISIVIPLRNEEESLEPLIGKIFEVTTKMGCDYEVIFIDDGSTDGSYSVLKKLHEKYPGSIQVIRFCRNYGKSAALSAGIHKATGDCIVTMDADLQDDPEAIPGMAALISQGWDVVSGWKKVRYDPISKTFPSKIWNTLNASVSGLKIHDFNCGLKMYRHDAAKSLEIFGERHRYLPALAHWNGFKVTEMVVPHHPRQFGKTKYGSMMRGFNGLFDLMTILFLKKYLANPLHFFGIIGILFLLAGSAIMGYFGIAWLISGVMRIRPLMFLAMGLLFMGIQFISIGLLGEMITLTKAQKSYQIRDELP